MGIGVEPMVRVVEQGLTGNRDRALTVLPATVGQADKLRVQAISRPTFRQFLS